MLMVTKRERGEYSAADEIHNTSKIHFVLLGVKIRDALPPPSSFAIYSHTFSEARIFLARLPRSASNAASAECILARNKPEERYEIRPRGK